MLRTIFLEVEPFGNALLCSASLQW